MATHLYTVCWNEADMLGFFFRHYDPWIDRYVVYDDGSTDGSLEILSAHPRVELRRLQRVDAESFVISHTEMQEHAWKESRGQAEWVVITAIDEHLWLRGTQTGHYLRRLRAAGITCVPALGFDMNSEEFPADHGLLIETVTRGRARRFFNKLSIFDPSAIGEVGYVQGRHKAVPTGQIRFPPRDELLLWHYKHLGFERTVCRHAAQAARLGSKDREHGWGHRYLWPRERLAWQWRAMRATSVDLSGLSDPALGCERPLWWRPDERLSDLLGPGPAPSETPSTRPPRVSVVVKSFNHEKYIRHCVQSVLNQSLQDFELVITDDASTDDTVAVVQSMRDSRIKLEQLPHNHGISGAMNRALSRATGEYIAILNSDDWAVSDRLETQVAFMDAHPNIGVVFGIPTFVDDRDELTEGFNDFRAPLAFPDFSRETWLRYFFLGQNCLCAPTALLRRDVLRRVGDYDVRLTNLQDLDYWIRLVLAGFDMHVENRVVTAFRVRDGHRNMSAPRTDNLLRNDFEHCQILRHFRSIDPELLTDTPAADRLSPAARLAKLAFSADNPVHQSFALQTLYEQARSLDDLVLLRELSGSADLFGRLTRHRLSDRIVQLEEDLEKAPRHSATEELTRLLGSRSWRYTNAFRRLFGLIQNLRRGISL